LAGAMLSAPRGRGVMGDRQVRPSLCGACGRR
jgi:hypothetical protein